MKKLISMTLALVMAFSLAACSGQDDAEVNVLLRQNADEQSVADAVKGSSDKVADITFENIYVDTLNDALMMVTSGKADHFITNEATANYLAARDAALKAERSERTLTLHILMLAENAGLNEKINTAIGTMKAEGVLDTLYAEYVTAVISGGEPAAVELPVYDGADTITIGVSGDMPPIDYVNTDGKPVGYNMAVLAEVSKRLECNIQVVVIDGGTRFAALSSGKVDAFFWQTNDGGIEMSDGQTTYVLSDAYAELYAGGVERKD